MGRGDARGQATGPLGRPTKEEIIMRKASDLVDKIFDEGFDNYSKVKVAERHVDFLLDMCGTPHHKRKVKEDMDPVASSMYVTGRPYDHPRKIRVKPIVDVNMDEVDVDECGPVEGEPYPGEFEGASPNNLPEEEPAKEMTPQKKQNKINTVPNQDASALLAAIKGEMVDEMKIGSSQAKFLVDKAKRFMKRYNAKVSIRGGKTISLQQAARMVARK